MENSEKWCAFCSWFHSDDAYGFGCCALKLADVCRAEMPCNNEEYFVSRKQMRHYLAVLLQANRYRRDQHVPSSHKMPSPTELGEAIDFAYKYIKTFSDL